MGHVASDREALDRLVERLRSVPEARLTRRDESGGTAAEAAHALARWAARATGSTAPVPVLHPLASGDQLAVVGRELLDWAEARDDPSATPVLEEWRVRVRALRDRL